jgi:hypothetical protein
MVRSIRDRRRGGRNLRQAVDSRRVRRRVIVFSDAPKDMRDRMAQLKEIDRAATRRGTIVCEDGLRLGSLSPGEMRALCAGLDLEPEITEVDGSAVFCEVVKP